MTSLVDSNVPWVGKIPETWSINPLFSVCNNNKTKNTEKNENVLSLSYGKIIKRDLSKNFGLLPENFDSYQIVEKGYVIIRPTDLQNDKKSLRVGLVKQRGVITSVYIGLSPHSKLCSEYLFYYLHMCDLKKVFYSLGGGLRQSLRYDEFRRFPIVTPPTYEEQKLISEYLDKKTEQIDSLIEKIQKKIELLIEQRTSLINQCVTKGLDPNVDMKDSGVEWIGKIPKHWEVTRLKYHGEILIGLSFDKDDMVDEDQGTLVLRSSNVQNGKVTFSDNVWVRTEVPNKLFVQEGDILICSRNGSRNLIGKNCLLGQESLGMTWGVFMSVFRSRYSEFFYWILNSQVFISQSGLFLTSTINQLTVSTLENLVFPFVHDRDEQNKINEHLRKETGSIDKLIDKEQRRISLLKEYRQSLISSVVTGKVRVTEDMI
jgi:type I restriction enzyme, S subunit